MAQVQYEMPVRLLHGKTHQKSKGYYYVTPEGKQKYRTREENYLQQHSEEAAKKTEAQSISDHIIRLQIERLSLQIEALRRQLNQSDE